jgi:hypothetical protein
MGQTRRNFMEVLLRFRYALAFLLDPSGIYVVKDGEKVTQYLILGDEVFKLNGPTLRPNGKLTLRRKIKAAKLIFNGKMVFMNGGAND